MRLIPKITVTGFQAILHLVVAAAFTLLVFTDHSRVGYVVAFVGLLGIAIRITEPKATRVTPALLVLTAAVLATIPMSAAGVGAAAVLLVLIAAQSTLASIGRAPRVRAFNLPGYRPPEPATASADKITAAAVALVAALAATGYESWPVWPVGIAASVTLLAIGAIVWRARLRAMSGRPDRHSLRAALDQIAPEFVVYFARERHGPGEEHQLIDWLPYVDQIGRPYMIITRELRIARGLRNLTTAPVLHCPTVVTIDSAITPSLRAALHINNSNLNSHILRFSELIHIALLHGDSDKPDSFHRVTSVYDRIFAAGPAAVRRYADHGVVISESKFDIVGRPQVAGVTPARAGRDLEAGGGAVVLYASTIPGQHSDDDFCSLRLGEPVVRALLAAGATVILRGHPVLDPASPAGARLRRLGRLLRKDRARTGRPHVWGAAAAAMTLTDAMNASDALIGDVSAVAVDYLASGKPYALIDVRGAASALAPISPLVRAGRLIDRDASDAAAVVARLLADVAAGSAAEAGPGAGEAVGLDADTAGRAAARAAIRERYLAPDTFVATMRAHLSRDAAGDATTGDTTTGDTTAKGGAAAEAGAAAETSMIAASAR